MADRGAWSSAGGARARSIAGGACARSIAGGACARSIAGGARRRAALAAAALAVGAACSSEPETPREPLPGRQLAARVERQLEADRATLGRTPNHLGLLAPVPQDELAAFMAQIRLYGDAREIVVGSERGFETHGGGVLALLLDHWRPEGRPATLDDAWPFGGREPGVPLASLYASHLRQVVLPESGLPRLRFGASGALGPIPVAETDAWPLLRILATRGASLDARWETFAGAEVSARELIDRARQHYLTTGDPPREPDDHSELHLVEILLAASARTGEDPEPVKHRFLTHELARRTFEPGDETLLLAHHAESLGRLVADERLAWSDDERSRVRAWLAALESQQFLAPETVPVEHLAHLLHGLRLVEAHAARLGG